MIHRKCHLQTLLSIRPRPYMSASFQILCTSHTNFATNPISSHWKIIRFKFVRASSSDSNSLVLYTPPTFPSESIRGRKIPRVCCTLEQCMLRVFNDCQTIPVDSVGQWTRLMTSVPPTPSFARMDMLSHRLTSNLVSAIR